jgi:chemotaxis protein CheC
MNGERFTDIEIDKLKEVANIIAGNADTALSKVLGHKVNMTVPESFIGSVEKVHQSVKGADDVVSAILLKLDGDVSGAMLVIFSSKDAVNLAKMLGKDGLAEDADVLHDFDVSALTEVGNVLLGASASALKDFLGLSVQQSVPDIATDMLGAIMDSVLVEVRGDNSDAMAVRVDLDVDGHEICGDIYYLFDEVSTVKVLEKLNEM